MKIILEIIECLFCNWKKNLIMKFWLKFVESFLICIYYDIRLFYNILIWKEKVKEKKLGLSMYDGNRCMCFLGFCEAYVIVRF